MLQPTRPGPGYRAFVAQLHALGYEEGRNLQIDYVELDSADPDRSLAMAAGLVGRRVDAIRAGGTEFVLKTAVAATKTVPIVMVASDYDPLTLGYVASLARPGGNVTGVASGRDCGAEWRSSSGRERTAPRLSNDPAELRSEREPHNRISPV